LPDSETYLHLAEACLSKAEADRQNKRLWVRRGKDACRSAIGLDVNDRAAGEAKGLLRELAEAGR
jgi:hypothetical protein